MDTMSAFARGEASRDKPQMVFDWNKAAEIIRDKNASYVEAGLCDDWEYTGGLIWNEKIVPKEETYVYLASTWAIPQMEVDGITVDCYIMEDDVPEEWGDNYAGIYWPQSAIDILKDA